MTETTITTGTGEQISVECDVDGLDDGAAILCLVDTDDMGRNRVAAVLTQWERQVLAAALDPERLSPETVAEIERWATDRIAERGDGQRIALASLHGSRSCGWPDARDGDPCGDLGAGWTAYSDDPEGAAFAVCDGHVEAAREAGWRVQEHRGPVPPADVPPGVVVKADVLDGGYVAEATGLPGCVSQGDTVAEAVANLRDAMTEHIAANAAAVASEGQADG